MEALHMKYTIERQAESSHNSGMSDNMLNARGHIGGIGRLCNEGNVVKTLTIGNTKVKICDDYCRNRTPFDVQAILKRIAFKAQIHLSTYADEHKNK